MRWLYLAFIFMVMCVFTAAAAQPKVKAKVKPPAVKAVLTADTGSAVNVRHFNQETLNKYRKLPQFQYNAVDTGPSLWTRFWRWFWHLFDFLDFKPNPHGGFWPFAFKFLEYFIIAAGVAGIVFLILKLVGIDMFNLFRRGARAAGIPYSESLENIHDINFDTEIESAIAQHNYRLAVRLLYLKCLKQLSDASLIHWQPEKTNSAYIDELRNTGQHGAFTRLTHQFEYVWYGEFPIDGQVFKQINSMFQNFKNEIA